MLSISSSRGVYQVHFLESLKQVPSRLNTLLANRQVVILSNPTIWDIYGVPFTKIWHDQLGDFDIVLMPDGESFKSLSVYQSLVLQIDALGLQRSAIIVAFGGGVVGDMAGFLAATLLRGIDWVQIPTTILAMVDSSIGGKVAVNLPTGKNRLGAFYPPNMVCAPQEVIATLSKQDIRSGLGEIIKHAILKDADLLQEILDAPSIHEIKYWSEILERSCRVKAHIVEQDEREKGIRLALNLGHTIGHALEKLLNYQHLQHGECVAFGLLVELDWMVQQGWLVKEVWEIIDKIIKKLDMSIILRDIDKEAIFDAISFDKKFKYDMIELCVVHDLEHFEIQPFSKSNIWDLCQSIHVLNQYSRG